MIAMQRSRSSPVRIHASSSLSQPATTPTTITATTTASAAASVSSTTSTALPNFSPASQTSQIFRTSQTSQASPTVQTAQTSQTPRASQTPDFSQPFQPSHNAITTSQIPHDDHVGTQPPCPAESSPPWFPDVDLLGDDLPALHLDENMAPRRRHSSHRQPSASLARPKPYLVARASTPPPPTVIPDESRPLPPVTPEMPLVGSRPPSPPSPPSLPSPPSPSSLAPTGAGAPPSLPKTLLSDLSLYTNPILLPENNGTTLEELAHLVRLSKYQERKCAYTRIRLHRSLVATALSARLTRCGEIAHRNLADSFYRGDKDKIFAALHNAVHEVKRSCEELHKYALYEPQIDSGSAAHASTDSLDKPPERTAGPGPLDTAVPFLSEIPATAREAFIDFLVQIRTNPNFVATRICTLSTAELNAFASFHRGLEPVESVLPGPSNGRPHVGSAGRNGGLTDVERLISFQRHDPLSALVYTCFANSAGPDSAEDRKRTEVWATACARLISEAKTTMEPFVISVLNIWTSMREWAGKSNMEWFLMKILENGAFLLERAEDQHGTRLNVSDWNSRDSLAAEEFYDRAVHELFEIIDDEDHTGIPEGLIELGNAILDKLDVKNLAKIRNWLVYRWLFSSFLLGVIIHPEVYGLLAEYHIIDYGRQKILKEVAMKAQRMVVEMTWSSKPQQQQKSVPPRIQAHIESILGKFNGTTKSRKSAARLLPARSITSLRETVEVRPYLVVSPADLATLVNALFPEQRPQSATSSSFKSVAPSISCMSSISQAIPTTDNPRHTFDMASIVSTSLSSTVSDATTSREPLLEDNVSGSSRRYSPPVPDPALSNYDEDGHRLRLALEEMNKALGPDVVRGAGHPCGERWAVLFVSSDGKYLSTQMTYDIDDDVDDDDDGSSVAESDSDDESDDGPDLGKDYHQLRDSILKLVEDYEIPREPGPDKSRATLTNKVSGLKKYLSTGKMAAAADKPPARKTSARYRKHPSFESNKADDLVSLAGTSNTDLETTAADEPETEPVLIAMLNAATTQSRAQTDFVSAHLYWNTLRQLNRLDSPSLRENGFAVLINIFARGPRDSIRHSAAAIEEYDAWLIWLRQSHERHEATISRMMQRIRALRDKTWYVTVVQHSREYEHTKDICVALKTMGMTRRRGSFQRSRPGLGRNMASYLYRNESQIMDLLAASEENGGPNKLGDDQSEKTQRWLQQFGVENFCAGEERIHRFCCEVESCIAKLVGENISEAPVLWSSDLYKRDKRALDTAAKALRERDYAWADDASSVVGSEVDRRFGPRHGAFSSHSGPVRALSAQHTGSLFSSDPGRSTFNFARIATNPSYNAADGGTDGADGFGVSSPVHTIDSASTFWSPFQSNMSASSATSRAHSPTTSVTNLSSTLSQMKSHHSGGSQHSHGARPSTSISANDAAVQQRLDEERSRFLAELRQALTSLLLSDLGNVVFPRGSETDAWFDGLGQELIERQAKLDKKTRQAAVSRKDRPAGRSPKPRRALEKKKSFSNLRGASDSNDRGGGAGLHSAVAATVPAPAPDGQGGQGGQTTNDSSATSDTVSGRPKLRQKDTAPEFPFRRAYQRLLKMFCVHPNPYAKLNALHELEHLIMASQSTSGSRKTKLGWSRPEFGTGGGDDGETKSNPLQDAIDNMKERRSNALMQSPSPMSPLGGGGGGIGGGGGGVSIQARMQSAEMRAAPPASPANTDAITNVLQSLFRDGSIRPKTLFRDLQFIAAFVPPSVLDKTDHGKAFWDAGLAALGLKLEVCSTMLEVADQVVEACTQGRDAAPVEAPPTNPTATTTSFAAAAAAPTATGPTANPSGSLSPPLASSRYTLADAGRMYSIMAREGFPTAQRELALFYLSKPELVERVTLPLSKPREVFKQAVMDKFGGGPTGRMSGSGRMQQQQHPSYYGHQNHHQQSQHQHHHAAGGLAGAGGGPAAGEQGGSKDLKDEGGRSGDPRDPLLMCVAMHWMEAAEQGGDEVARQFLRQQAANG